jgi:hypothetical protein
MTSLEVFYLICAIVGGVLFVLRAIMFFVAGGFDAEFGSDLDGAHAVDLHDAVGMDLHGGIDLNMDGIPDAGLHDVGMADLHDAHAMDAAHSNTDVSFKFISLQGLTAFFMMFGLAGLALSKSGQPDFVTVLGGIIAGAFTVWVISRIFIGAQRLQSEGTLNMQNAIGLSGTVYLSIPAGDIGKVNLVLQGALKEFNAVAADQQPIKTGEHVRVVGLTTGEVLVVEKINE